MKTTVWGDLPESAHEARTVGVDIYYTGKACVRGHYATRSRRYGNCSGCNRMRGWLNFYGYRMPKGTDVMTIDYLYQRAAWLSAETGVPHEVDHIIPLNGEKVSGLHVMANLQILTRKANHDKGNSWNGA